MFPDKTWNPSYSSDDGSLAERFYIPVLMDAVQYDRGTGYFTAQSLVYNMRGMEGLVRNGGRMRLLVGCTLSEKEVMAIQKGEDLRRQVEQNLCSIPLDPPDSYTKDGLEMLSWMIATEHLEIKVAIRCGDDGVPLADALYHKKIGIARDREENVVAWSGSDNETPHGQSGNSEVLHVYTSWNSYDHQVATETEFEKDWLGRDKRTIVMNVSEAVQQRLLQHAPPKGQLPSRLKKQKIIGNLEEHYNQIFSFINGAHNLDDGLMMGLTTAPVRPWPHQIQVFRRLYSNRPTKLLIADEVGLGKTIQAGLFLRQMWLEGRRRMLVMAPAGLTRQWQIELREKLNLDWPIYDGKCLSWQSTHACPDRKTVVGTLAECDSVIMSSHLARREERANEVAGIKWDAVVLDEAHHARRSNPGNPSKGTPNKMLKLMRRIKTIDLVLLTATPMQTHQVDLYDLLLLLGVPPKWTLKDFETFYESLDDVRSPFVRRMFTASEEHYGQIDASRLGVSRGDSKRILRMLRGGSDRPHTRDYDTMKKALLLCSPVTRLISRNTRHNLRQHIQNNNLDWRLGRRRVHDEFINMNPDERRLYDALTSYISQIWNTYKGTNRQAVGFVLTIYRKRLASSFVALRKTLENHLLQLEEGSTFTRLYEDEYDDGDGGDGSDGDYAADSEVIKTYEEQSLKAIDKKSVLQMLEIIRSLPPSTKFDRLVRIISDLLSDGYRQVMIFTQFIDTMDFLRDKLKHWKIMCYSGRAGEYLDAGGTWKSLSREETKKKFSEGYAEILLCTDAAAEGLNFQFCGAMINYDMPWNPMRIEQRIGRIDRIGQEHAEIRIVNMYYENTIEADIYKALKERINLFEGMIGTLQPILSSLNRRIRHDALTNGHDTEKKIREEETSGLDLDSMLEMETINYEQPKSPVIMEDLERLANSSLMQARPVGKKQYSITGPNNSDVRITTDRDTFENISHSAEFWSPGSSVFPKPSTKSPPQSKHKTLGELLDSLGL